MKYQKILYSILLSVFLNQNISIANEGSGSGGSGGSYHEIDFTTLPDEIVIEKVIHHSSIQKAAFSLCDYLMTHNGHLYGTPWEFFVRKTVKIRKERDAFRSDQPKIKHQIFGRSSANAPWLDVHVYARRPDVTPVPNLLLDVVRIDEQPALYSDGSYRETDEGCKNVVIYESRFQLAHIIWVDQREHSYQNLTPEEFKVRLDLVQNALEKQAEISMPQTIGNYAAFLRIVNSVGDFSLREKNKFKEYPDLLSLFRSEVLKRTHAFIAESDPLNEGESREDRQKFLEAYDLWATQVDAWKLGTTQWIQEFELKSQTKLDSKMKKVLDEARLEIDQRLSRLALRAERVRRLLAAQLAAKNKGKAEEPPVKPKKHLKIEK